MIDSWQENINQKTGLGGRVMNKLIDIKGLYKSFDGNDVLSSIDLYIRENEFMTLLGPSGCYEHIVIFHLVAAF